MPPRGRELPRPERVARLTGQPLTGAYDVERAAADLPPTVVLRMTVLRRGGPYRQRLLVRPLAT